MKFTININLDNDAFADGQAPYEVARILRSITQNLEVNGESETNLFDVNGNKVGLVEYPIFWRSV